MRGNPSDFEMRAPAKLKDALALISDGWRPFAGGTDLMVQLEAGTLPAGRYASLLKLKELGGIVVKKSHITIGALVTYMEIREHKTLRKEFSMLCKAAELSGATAIQNRGTLGGNIANASPAADSPPALLAYDADLELVSQEGSRWIPYCEFHLGYKKTLLAPGELIRAIRLPRKPGGYFHFYRKVGTRKAQAISKICFSGSLRLDKGVVAEVRIALGAVAPTPVRCRRAEEALLGKPLDAKSISAARKAFDLDIAPIDDIRSTARFRNAVARNVLEEFLAKALGDETDADIELDR